MPVFLQKRLVKTSAVHTDADGDVPRTARIHHRAHAILAPDVAGVDADLCRAALGSQDRQTVVKMDVRHQRQRRIFADFGKAVRRLAVRHGKPRDLAARRRQRI